MPGGHELELPGVGLQACEQQGCDLNVVPELQQETVEAREKIGEVVADARIGACRVTELRHQACRAQAMSADITDRQHHAPVRKEERVVPVAADLPGAVLGGEISSGDLERGERGEAGPNQRLLEDLHRPTFPRQTFACGEERGFGRALFGDVLERPADCDELLRVVVDQDLAPVDHLADAVAHDEPALHHVPAAATGEGFVRRTGQLRGVVGMRRTLQRLGEFLAGHRRRRRKHAGHLRRQA